MSLKPAWGRAYFAVQAAAGLCWWIAVFASPAVRQVTLGSLDPVAVALCDVPFFVVGSALAALGLKAAALVSTGWTALVLVALAVYATLTSEAGWGVVVMGAATLGSLVALCAVVLGRLPTEWITRGPFGFRPAAPRASVGWHVIATGAQLIFFWGLFLGVFPAALVFFEHRWGVGVPPGGLLPAVAATAGLVVLIPASVLGFYSAAVMSIRGHGTPLPAAMPQRLVIAGPYRWVRNPMAVAGVSQCIGVGILTQSWLVIAYSLTGALIWNYAVRPQEEADLQQRFGADFARYREAVRCWVPRVPQ